MRFCLQFCILIPFFFFFFFLPFIDKKKKKKKELSETCPNVESPLEKIVVCI